MAVIDSRIKSGSLEFTSTTLPAESVNFACQPTSAALTPSVDSGGDPVQTLCGDQLAGASVTTWTLDLTAIQDWTNLEGFINWAFDHDGETWEYALRFDTEDVSPTWGGQVVVAAVPIGGEPGTRLTSDGSWQCTAKPTRTDPVQAG
jgi:hypothetical protein